jgi:hypothetical protein
MNASSPVSTSALLIPVGIPRGGIIVYVDSAGGLEKAEDV